MTGIGRREFVKSAVAIGGAAALSACLDREGDPDVPGGPDDPSALPERQHAWNDVLATDDYGNALVPRHHVLLLLERDGVGPPTDDDREAVAAALASLDRAYRRGSDGLLSTVGYTHRYFARFDDSPAGVDLPEPTALAPFEDPEPDRPDALVHLASDRGSVVLAAEEALRGERDELNGVAMGGAVTAAFDVAERRTGFVGAGLPAANQDVRGVPDGDHVPEDSPLYMGFKSGFRRNQASEDRVTVQSGPFADGTTAHLSRIRLHLEQWYEQDSRDQRVARMFCPAHAETGRVEGVGENLGDGSAVAECDDAEADAKRGVVGHSQKLERVREGGAPRILRRDFDSTDGGAARLHFLSLQRTVRDFVETRETMNGTDLAEESPVGKRVNNGILQYLTVERRGNYLLPPRRHRALPRPNPETEM